MRLTRAHSRSHTSVSCESNVRYSRELIDFCALHNIKPQIELMPFDRVNEAVELVRKNKPRYRIVLAHAQK